MLDDTRCTSVVGESARKVSPSQKLASSLRLSVSPQAVQRAESQSPARQPGFSQAALSTASVARQSPRAAAQQASSRYLDVLLPLHPRPPLRLKQTSRTAVPHRQACRHQRQLAGLPSPPFSARGKTRSVATSPPMPQQAVPSNVVLRAGPMQSMTGTVSLVRTARISEEISAPGKQADTAGERGWA